MKCVLEYGINWYKYFDSVTDAIKFRNKIGSNGIIYTEDGFLINEQIALKEEKFK